MPPWLIIVLSIIAILAIIVLVIIKSHLDIHITYDSEIRAYAQFLFIKVRLFKKHKYLKERLLSYKESDLPLENVKESNELFYEDIIDLIDEFRDIIEIFAKHLFDCMVFKVVNLNISVGSDDAVSTTFAHTAVSQSVAYLLAYINEISSIDPESYQNVNVIPNYTSRKSHFNTSITIRLPLIEASKRLYKYI